jgi:hypothetical protein
VLNEGATADTFAPGGAIVAVKTTVSTVDSHADLDVSVGTGAVLSAAGLLSVKALSNNQVNAESRGIVGGAVGVGITRTNASATGTTRARANGATLTAGSMSVSATGRDEAVATTSAVAGGLFAMSGNTATASVSPTVEASASSNIHVTGTLTVIGVANVSADAETSGIDAGVIAIGVNESDASVHANVAAHAGGSITAGTLIVSAVTQRGDAGYSANASAEGSAGALFGGVSTNANTSNTSNVDAYVDDSSTLSLSSGSVLIAAINDTLQSSSSDSHAGGLVAAGIASSDASSTSDTEAYIGSNANVTASALTISAGSTDNNFAASNAGSGGLVAGDGLVATTHNTSTTNAQIHNGSATDDLNHGTGTLTIAADHNAIFDTQATAFAGGLLAGAGAVVHNPVTSSVNAGIGNDVTLNAKNRSWPRARRTSRRPPAAWRAAPGRAATSPSCSTRW